MTQHQHIALDLGHRVQLSADEIVLADGSLWSHIATFGTRTKDGEFTIDEETVQNFVKVFTSGYPQKVPVDYEHASTDGDPDIKRARAQGDVVKAGEVKELRGVYATADFTGDLKATAEKLCERVGRQLDDDRNLGLWMRWEPTPKAMERIRAKELTETSITFVDDYPDAKTGKGQGPAILAVALTMMPFLDDMLPVAASRGAPRRQDPAAGTSAAADAREAEMTKITMLAAVGALVAKPVADEDAAVTELTRLQPELVQLRAASTTLTELGTEVGETDPAKVLTKVKELKASNAAFKQEAETQRKARIAADVEATMKKYESRLTVPMRTLMAKQLSVELEAGTKLEEAETAKALESLPDAGIAGQSAAGDIGGSNAAGDDQKLDAKAKELLSTDEDLKALNARQGFAAAFPEALNRARKQLSIR
jgi:hypothetical protein